MTELANPSGYVDRHWHKQLREQDAEISRLRREIANELTAVVQTTADKLFWRNEAERLRAELEQARAELARLSRAAE